MMESRDIIADLTAESEAVDQLVSGLDSAGWQRPTPAPGWTVAHQIAHLAATFRMAALATANPVAFEQVIAGLSDDFDANVAAALAEYVAEPPQVLLSRWRSEYRSAITSLAALPPERLVPWLVRPLPAQVLGAAGIMELFAHGQDIADGLGVRRQHTDRIWHLVEFAIRNWDFCYQVRGRTAPRVRFRFELTAPSGTAWEFGPANARQRITGPAADFCFLVTRRRHRADLRVEAVGADADEWLDIAQAYRGPAGSGRVPGQFAALA